MTRAPKRRALPRLAPRAAQLPGTFVCALLLCGSCSSPQTAVRLEVTYDDAWALENLTVTASGQSLDAPLAHHVRMVLPDGWAGQPINVVVWGNKGGQHFAGGNVTVTPVLKQEISAQVALSRVPCGAWCTAGAMECQGNNTVVCTANDRGCTDWTSPTACLSSTPYCSFGTCSATCVDECAMGEQRCEGPSALRNCGQGDADSCLDWLPALPCAQGQICSNGACVAVCQNECTAGEVECLGAGTITCGDLDHNGCTEWGPVVPCANGTTCSNGACSASCTDDCTASMCSGTTFQMCGQFDLDSCKDLSPGISCVPADPCMVGSCTASGCKASPKSCSTPPASTCQDANTLTVYDSTGTCMGGTCSYVAREVACPNCPSCDACAGVTCNTPPAPVCTLATSLRTYHAPGTCGSGSCSYPYVDMTCACKLGACSTSNAWTTAASMPTARGNLAASTGLDDRIYAIGGSGGGPPLNVLEVYTPASNSWASLAPMGTARLKLGAATGVDGRIYAVGGADGITPFGTVEAYTPSSNSWTTVAAMPTPRDRLAVAAGLDGRIYAIGGTDEVSVLDTVEVYTPSTNSWSTAAPLPTARMFLTAVMGLDGRIYAIGGSDGQNELDIVEIYTPSIDSWATGAAMPTGRTALGAARDSIGRIVTIGGAVGGAAGGQLSNQVEIYSPGSNSWAPAASMPTPRFALATGTDASGRVYAIGGSDGSKALNTVEVYTP